MPTFNVELNHKPKRNGLYTLLLRVTINRKHKRISLGRHIQKKDFNPKCEHGKWIRTTHPNYASLNKHIKKSILEQESKFNNATEDLSIVVDTKRNIHVDLFAFADIHISRLRALGKYRTSEKRTHIINKLKLFADAESLPFSKLTTSFLKDYEAYLKSKLDNHTNTIYGDMKGIKSILNDAISEEYLDASKSPFLNYRLKTIKTFKERLTITEIKEIEELDLGVGSMNWHVRNYFLFSYYTAGVRYGDFYFLNDIIYDRAKKEYPPFAEAVANLKLPPPLVEDNQLERLKY